MLDTFVDDWVSATLGYVHASLINISICSTSKCQVNVYISLTLQIIMMIICHAVDL